jgi:hypothetical protein
MKGEINYDTLDSDIMLIDRLVGTYDSDSADYYNAFENVMLYLKESRGVTSEPPTDEQVEAYIGAINEPSPILEMLPMKEVGS